jgi:hypothetical protein
MGNGQCNNQNNDNGNATTNEQLQKQRTTQQAATQFAQFLQSAQRTKDKAQAQKAKRASPQENC